MDGQRDLDKRGNDAVSLGALPCGHRLPEFRVLQYLNLWRENPYAPAAASPQLACWSAIVIDLLKGHFGAIIFI